MGFKRKPETLKKEGIDLRGFCVEGTPINRIEMHYPTRPVIVCLERDIGLGRYKRPS